MATSTATLTAWTAPSVERRPVTLRRAPRLGRHLVTAAIVALLGLLVMGGVTGRTDTASAFSLTCPFGTKDDAAKNNSSEAWKSGVDALTPWISPATGVMTQGSKGISGKPVPTTSASMTAYEYYGMSGATWTTATEDCGAIGSVIGNITANYMFSGTKAIVTLSISMYQWASSPTLLADFYKPMDAVVKGLKQNLYLNFLSPVIVLGALWMGWVGLVKKRTTEATQGAVWMICSAVFALVFMAWPSWVANQANSVVSTINSTAMTAVTGATGKSISEADICYVSSSARTSERKPGAKASQQKAASSGVRMASCSIYKALVYTPWAAGQFGVPVSEPLVDGANKTGVKIPGHAENKDLRLSQLEAQAVNAEEAKTTEQSDRKAIKEADTKRWENIQKRAEKEAWYSTWTGDSIGGRVNVGLASIIAAIAAGALILVISFASIVLALGMVLLIMVAPLFLLIGAHPGVGRGIALKWLELLLGTVVKRIMLGFLLAILIGFYQVILATPMAWFSQVCMIIAVGVGALMYRKPLLEAMNVVNLGGSRAGIEGGTWDRHAKKAGAGALGAASGAVNAGMGARGDGVKAMLGGMAGGALSGGMMGARSGNPLRAAQMGAGAGRRTAARQEARRNEKVRKEAGADDPFLYDKEQKRQAKEAANMQVLAEQYADDPEMQRRLASWADKTGRPVPRPGEGAAASPGAPVADGTPGEAGAPAADSGGAPPRPVTTAAGTAVLPDADPGAHRPASDPVAAGSSPRPSGASPDLAYSDVQARIDKEQDRRHAAGPAPADDLVAQQMARARQIAERNGHKPTLPRNPQ